MQSKEFFRALKDLASEKDIPLENLLEIIAKGITNAYKKEYDHSENVRVEFRPERNEILLFAQKKVVERRTNVNEEILLKDAKKILKSAKKGDIIDIEIKKPKEEFGRLAATSAKQVLTQGIKQLEREVAYEYFSEHEGEMLNVSVVSINDEFIVLDLGKGVSTNLPVRETLPRDKFTEGFGTKVYITKVEQTTKGPKVYVSRTDKNLVKRLLEEVVPEINEGIVEIAGLARDPGDRTKVAVMSNDENVDPVGACLGQNSTRIKEVVKWLNDEKIDVFEWSTDPVMLVANSLQPAKVVGVNINQKKKEALAIVPDNQLSLAIGKRGQNVRLAVQASGWKIDIKSESEARKINIRYAENVTKR